jgi:hypothetical protein
MHFGYIFKRFDIKIMYKKEQIDTITKILDIENLIKISKDVKLLKKILFSSKVLPVFELA